MPAAWSAAQVMQRSSSLKLAAQPNKGRSLASGKLGADSKHRESFLLPQPVQATECHQHVRQLPAALAFNSVALKCQAGSLPLA